MMSSGTLRNNRAVGWIRIGLTALLVLGSTVALAWEQPSEWPEIGMVSKWREYDAQFYRIHEDAPFTDQSQFKLDQAKEYAQTREYKGKMDGIGLETYLAKDADEQMKRRKQAAKELRFVADFHQRMQTLVQRTKQPRQGSGWGIQVADMTVIGDCLGKLRTAVLLDPSNPYAWHVLGYFSDFVGDKNRAATAFTGAKAALDKIPTDQLTQLRAEVALDQAWLQRDQGNFEDAMNNLKAAVEYGAKGTGPRLLQGLIAAQTGETQKAVEIAGALRSAEVRVFPPNLRSTGFSPELSDVSAWRGRPSNYLQSWILALTWLYEGNADMAAAAFGKFALNDQYPFAERFWNDAGRIYEITGRRSSAHKAWSMARINTPYIVYFVYKPYAVELGKLTGRPGAVPFFLGFDLFYTNGNRLAYGADLVEKVAAAEDEFEKQELAARALDELELCKRTGIYPGQAQVLMGQVYYLMGDLGSALLEVESALKLMEEQGDIAGSSAVLQGLAKSKNQLAKSDLANFYSQSGTSSGRWMKAEDREAQLAGLRKAYADDPTAGNRQGLARFLIRDDQVVEGRDLAMGDLKGQELTGDNITQLAGDDLALVLEADRAEGEDELALALVQALEDGATDPWNHAGLWILVGFICLDGGDIADGKVALERALELDPGNQGLKIQLALMQNQAGG
jgi:tetratricopeptide (TPR) repeat protein